ncbi:TATA box-binding protein-associated factor RNA polymerase I subunit B [Hermetia illucens]|uniref:TATA box-binding protein-associated factor RNA polymerase I subunit B n=1 Tax=Hermetia illucens TaxID=343691 RepID=UPI0018CC76AC|nr:TATA box-binding protein-associated factor RNA polymerase I subunit B [Hermetia illucens]
MAEVQDKCEICGETQFTAKEGFFYCNECGAQSQNIRDLEVDQAGIEESQVFFKSLKVTQVKAEKPQLTTWECFNYFLRGLVDELLNFGAKEEFKLTVLQLWTAYLRKCEVAFFSKKEGELPRLGPKYSERDATAIYNHKKIRQKRVRDSEAGSEKAKFTKRKRKHAKAEYEALSESMSAPSTSQNSSSSAASNRAIRLQFSRAARNFYKRFMPAKHLNKHEADSTYELRCHTLHSYKFPPGRIGLERLSRKIIFSLIYLALNLIGDDIQLYDLLRFSREGHLSTVKFSHFFPEDIAQDCMEVMTNPQYYGWTFFRSAIIRNTTANLLRFIHVPELRLPNITKMAKRFITDLSLPAELISFIERLYNLHPPKMVYKFGDAMTPCFEGRAMAYIIFTLKLLFVLDGEADLMISNSAKAVNIELKRLNEDDKQLFVWEDWVQYIEMRKLILTQCHYHTSVHLNENINYDQYIEHLREAYETPYEDLVKYKRTNLITMEKIFDDLHTKLKKKNPKDQIPSLKCAASLTPYSSYLNYILGDSTLANKLFIPDFMRDDPATKDIKPFVYAKGLKTLLRSNKIKLIVKKIGISVPTKTIGIFSSYPFHEKARIAKTVRLRTVEFDIGENEWVNNAKAASQPPDIFTKTEREFKEPKRPRVSKKSTMDLRKMVINKEICRVPADGMSVHSFDVYSEQNMEPLPEDMVHKQPRQFETESILTNLSDEETEIDKEERTQDKPETIRTVELKVSNFDCWNFTGINKYFHVDEIERIEKKLPKIFYWLLKTCAEMIEVDIIDLYQELLAIENQFLYALEPLDDFRNVLAYKEVAGDREIKKVIDFYKNLW